MSYTEGPTDRAWEVDRIGERYWVQRVGWDQRNNLTQRELIFSVVQPEAATELAARLNDLDRLRAQEPALLLRFADAMRQMIGTVQTAADGFIALETELRAEAQRFTQEPTQ